jgi:hypothetical protein
MSVIVLWEWDYYDGPICGIAMDSGQPVYFDMARAEDWIPLTLDEQATYTSEELERCRNLWSGRYYRYSQRSFHLYALTPREFATEQIRYYIWHYYQRCLIRIPGSIIEPPNFWSPVGTYQDWLDLHPTTDYTKNRFCRTVQDSDLHTWEEAAYWHLYFCVVFFLNQFPSSVNWSRLAQTQLVPIQLLRFIATQDFYVSRKHARQMTYDDLCSLHHHFWQDRRSQLYRLAQEAQIVGPMMIYQPGSRWVQPKMRQYFLPVTVKPQPLPLAYTQILEDLAKSKSRGDVRFLAQRLGLQSTGPGLEGMIRRYVELFRGSS